MPFAKSARRTSKWGSSPVSTAAPAANYDTGKLEKQIENARTRAVDAGFQENPDDRNWFEKLTNLPKDQNAFMDTLELLGRPSQAVLNLVDKVPSGDRGVGESLWRGFSGKDRVRGTDLTKDISGGNKYANWALGTGLEIALDPLTYVPGGAIAKGVKTAVAPVTRGFATGYKALETALPAVKRIRTETVAPIAEKAKDALGKTFVPQYQWDRTLTGETDDTLKNLYNRTNNQIQIMNEDAIKNVADSARAAGGVDTGIDVGRIMEAPLRQFEDVKGYEFPDGLTRTTDKKEIMQGISSSRANIKNLNKELKQTEKGYQSSIGELSGGLEKTNAEVRKLFSDIERQSGKDLDAATRQNLRDARKELTRIDSQINNFDAVQSSYLKRFEKDIQDAHVASFDLIKRVKETAPYGIKGVDAKEMPKGVLVRRNVGKGIDEVADELGYKYADDLVQELKFLKDIPQRLDKDTLRSQAMKEYQRVGADNYLEETLNSLIRAKQEVMDSVKQIGNTPKSQTAGRVTEKAFQTLSESPRYVELEEQRKILKNQLDSLKGESKEVKQAKISQIKQVEEEISNLRESIRNPVMIQREIERPARELSQSPEVQRAAQNLIQSNDTVRQWATENGVDVSELEGYMTHILSQEERAARTKRMSIDRGNAGPGQPKKAILNQRKLSGSVEDINERLDRNFFEPNAYFATAIGQKRLIEYANAVKFRRDVLSNPNFAMKYEKGMDIPNNAVVIDINNYKFIKQGIDDLPVTEEIGGQYLVTKGAKEALDRYQRLTTDDGVKGFLKAFDAATGTWKKFTLFSPGYHVRNAIGAVFNNYVGGMNVPDLIKYTKESTEEVNRALRGKESAMYREYREQGLGASSLSGIEFRPYNEPEKAITRTIEERSKDTKGKVIDRLKPQRAFETSRELGDIIDQSNRFALYKWARDKKGMTPEQAANKVREVQFDYSRTTMAEKEIITRMIPFYRWMRNNLPFQIRSFINDPGKYANVNKIRTNAQSAFGIEEENTPDWMKEQFALPVSPTKFLSLGLPAGDLTKVSDPLKLLVDGLTPVIKTPIELSTNYNLFYGKPIEKFRGQEKQFSAFGQDFGIPSKTAYALEQMTGQVGRGFSQYLQKPEDVDQDTKFRLPKLGINSIVKDYDPEASAYFEQLQQLQELQDYLKWIEQQSGEKPRTINEIKKGAR